MLRVEGELVCCMAVCGEGDSGHTAATGVQEALAHMAVPCAGDYDAGVGVGQSAGLKDVGRVAGLVTMQFIAGAPVPKNDVEIIAAAEEDISTVVKRKSIDTAFVALEGVLPLEAVQVGNAATKLLTKPPL